MRQTWSSGSTTLIGFLSALVVFSLVFATVLEFSLGTRSRDLGRAEAVNHDAQAVNLADLLFLYPGTGWYPAMACDADTLDVAQIVPDAVGQFALGEERCGQASNLDRSLNNISYEKLQRLVGAQLDADPGNGLVDYAEARRSLGLEGHGVDFHIRTWPLLPGVAELLRNGYKDPNLRPLYVGDYEFVTKSDQKKVPVLVQHTKGVQDNGVDSATLWVNVTNNGTVPTMFSVRFTVATQRPIEVEEHTPLLPVEATFNATLTVNKTKDWKWKDDAKREFDYLIRDKSQTVGQGTVSMAGLSMAHSGDRKILTAGMDKLVWVLQSGSVNPSVTYDNMFGDGGSTGQYSSWSLELRNASTNALVAVVPSGQMESKGGSKVFTLTSAGSYKVVLKGGDGWTAATDRFDVVAAEPDLFTPASVDAGWVPQAPVPVEVGYLAALVSHFDAGVYDLAYNDTLLPYVPGGDVLPDDNKVLADLFPGLLTAGKGQGTLANYNVLVMGSNVNHESLTSGNIKGPVEDFVEAGGLLIVQDSMDQSVHWLEPLFHVAIDSAGGGVSVPDTDHPLLNVPNRLDYAAFDTHGSVWEFNRQEDANHFTHVITEAAGDVLAVSDPGEFGKGRVILTSWQAYDMVPGPDAGCTAGSYAPSCPGLAVFNNMLTIAYHGLYIDYGPPIPAGAPVSAQSRILTLFHPELHEEVELYALVYVFG